MTLGSRFFAAAALLTFAAMAVEASADGLIVPVRPEIRVSGNWAVKYHHVDVKVRDQVAAVSIDQEFVNTGKGMIEVEYLFPVPPGAAIDSMTMVVAGKEYAARLLKADEARKIYEDIVRKKKDPALLEYAGFGLYKTRAFPLQPGKPCKVIVTYKNVCRKDRDLVEVWYPLNTEKFSARAIDSVRVRVDIKSKADIGPVYSPTHDLKVQRKDPRHAIATYEARKTLPTGDFQVFYKASNKAVGATLITHQGDPKKDGHFMLLVSPNPRSTAKAVVAKDVVCVLDTSGSMSGKRIDQAKEAMNFILRNLNSEDRFNLVLYNDLVESFFDGLVAADKAHIARAADMVDRIEASGGTNIHGALQTALKVLADATKGRSPRPAYLIFLTDGLPTVGTVKEVDILADAKKANTCGARIFAFGVGYNVNVRLLDKLVAQNRGRSGYVKENEAVETKVSSLYNKIRNPVMTELSVKVDGVKLRDVYPRELGDLFDGDQIVVVGRYDCADIGKLKRLETRAEELRASQLVIKGVYEGKERAFEYNVALRTGGRDMRFVFVEKIWAVRRVGWLLDQIQLHGKSKEVVDELIRLSRTYGIMTPYTSFLADETTAAARPAAVREKAAGIAADLADAVSGESAQLGAHARSELKAAMIAPRASAPRKAGGPGGDPDRGVVIYGNTGRNAYEREKVEYVAGIRNVGNLSLFRRGNLWMGPRVARLDLKKDADRITVIKRYSAEYFKLIRANSVSENQVMSSQQADEELLIELRGEAYLVK